MYVAEWIMWFSCLKSDNWIRKNLEEHSSPSMPVVQPAYEDSIVEDRERQAAKRFEYARSRGPVYACNDTYLEMRCGGMEDKRGLITLCSSIFLYFLVGMWIDFDAPVLWSVVAEPDGYKAWGIGIVVFSLVTTAGTVVLLWLYCKYALRITRLEALTSRHQLIRFNRITRQVYLHRPSSCGGILVLPWEGVQTDEVAGLSLVMGWYPGDSTDLPFPTLVFIGRQSSRLSDLQSEWEFIRRYMDEGGVQAVEKPRISSQLPLPWPAFTAQFDALWPFLRNSGPVVWLGCLLISPAFVILGLSHWASLLLCWRPRWPRIIREAGQAGKPVPAFTTVEDYPPDVRAQLLANAHRWALRPGRAPDNRRRGREDAR
ncbi:hypothetical protein [Achromobacter sp. MFA1 R4]|uniref:hypothetical protein n=1 Tax=Achromobacter sp. MFA1 R4 TaxID=1881016 RepID=UPI00095378D6|nr:hypothetical protein [Achromobacter sp. MFA1 R4]SIT11636.1 hypothetical protein SAMN05428937_0981 [Achromobacter sp. MFA1 R4]